MSDPRDCGVGFVGDDDPLAVAIGGLHQRIARLELMLREVLDEHDQVSKMEHRDWERARDLLGGYRSPLAER